MAIDLDRFDKAPPAPTNISDAIIWRVSRESKAMTGERITESLKTTFGEMSWFVEDDVPGRLEELVKNGKLTRKCVVDEDEPARTYYALPKATRPTTTVTTPDILKNR